MLRLDWGCLLKSNARWEPADVATDLLAHSAAASRTGYAPQETSNECTSGKAMGGGPSKVYSLAHPGLSDTSIHNGRLGP